jgi:CrcB protein
MALTLLLVAIGGAIGSVARYGVAQLGHRVMDDAAPAATLGVNLFGCFAIGLLAAAFAGPWSGVREDVRVGLIVGVLGGLTTFSAFGFETLRMIDQGHLWRAGWFAAVHVGAGVAGVAAGGSLARRVLGA